MIAARRINSPLRRSERTFSHPDLIAHYDDGV
jgi:hypothetical protein